MYSDLQLSSLQYFEQRLSRAPQDKSIKGPNCPHKECVVELEVDSYKSNWLKGLGYIDHWFRTHHSYISAYLLMSWLCDIDDTSLPEE